jgi:hypothetical protein
MVSGSSSSTAAALPGCCALATRDLWPFFGLQLQHNVYVMIFHIKWNDMYIVIDNITIDMLNMLKLYYL